MCGFQFVASFITYLALLRGSPTAWRFLFCSCYMLGFDLYAYVNPQFTITAGLVMQAGIISYLSWAESEPPTMPLAALFVGTVAVSCCIRELGCAMLLVLGMPAFVVLTLPELHKGGYSKESAKRSGTAILRRVAPLALGGTIYVLLMVANWSAYRSSGWEGTYRYFDHLCPMINTDDFPYNRGTRWIYDKLGWSHNDYEMLHLWGFIDRRLYSVENIETITSCQRKIAAPVRRSDSASVLSYDYSSATRKLADVLHSEDGSGFRLVLFALLLAIVSGNRSRLLIAVSTLFACAFLIVYLALVLDRCPPRVSFPIHSYLACVLIWATARSERPRSRFVSVGLLSLVVMLSGFCWVYIVQLNKVSESRVEWTRCYESAIDALRRQDRFVYVDWAGSLKPEMLSPWGGIEGLRGLRFVMLNVFQRTPLVSEKLSEYGINDLYEALYTRDDVWLLTNGLDSFVKTYKIFVREHYGDPVVALKERLLPDPRSTRCPAIMRTIKFAKW